MAKNLSKRYQMDPHEEGGSFVDLKAERVAGTRDASGAIYYYLPPDQVADFHVIDCDEYWAFVAGDTLELWIVSPDGKLAVELLGVEALADPLVFVPAGCMFAADLDDEAVVKSQALADRQRQIAADLSCWFLDAGLLVHASDVDSEHFSPETHAILAKHVAKVIRLMFE